ncbi:MAG: hypothetical protein GY765_07900, partial [bacterium]|nr:hypothetical protein [bacterium]
MAQSFGTPKPAYADGGPLRIPTTAPTTLTEALLATAATHPKKGIFFVNQAGNGEAFLSWVKIAGSATHVHAGLRANSIKKGEAVLLQVPDVMDYFPMFWGCVFAGAIPVTVAIPPSYGETNPLVNKILNTWELLGHPVIIGGESNLESLTQLGGLSGGTTPRLLDAKKLI